MVSDSKPCHVAVRCIWTRPNHNIATAVFTSTAVARRVLEAFNKWKDTRAVYNGVSVTYSSDPCEKELVLVKDTARPGFNKNMNFIKKSLR
jgi:hypothetical protein